MAHFLLIFDTHLGSLRGEPRQFSSRRSQEALRAYEQAEALYRNDQGVQVVLVGADSLETVKITHGSYFNDDPRALLRESLGQIAHLH